MNDSDQVNRERIFAAAKVLFSRYGFRKTTVDEIAEQANLSKRTMYKVFRSKEEILAELVLFEALKFRRFCMSQIKTLSDPRQKVETLCNLSNNYFNEFPFLGRVMADDERLFKPFLGEQVHLVEGGIREIVTNLLSEGIQAGVFRAMNVPDAAENILALMRTFAYHQELTPGNTEWVSFILHAVQKEEIRR